MLNVLNDAIALFFTKAFFYHLVIVEARQNVAQAARADGAGDANS